VGWTPMAFVHPTNGRTLIRSAISDTFASGRIVEVCSTGEPFREDSVGFLVHRHLECDPWRMWQGRIAKRH
jgi:hypothetical protein